MTPVSGHSLDAPTAVRSHAPRTYLGGDATAVMAKGGWLPSHAFRTLPMASTSACLGDGAVACAALRLLAAVEVSDAAHAAIGLRSMS